MWRMLTGRSADLSVELLDRAADADTGSAHWIARYTFGRTGRPVVNDVRSTFRFADGLIVDQRDEFDFPRWARQAGTFGQDPALVTELGKLSLSLRSLATDDSPADEPGTAFRATWDSDVSPVLRPENQPRTTMAVFRGQQAQTVTIRRGVAP